MGLGDLSKLTVPEYFLGVKLMFVSVMNFDQVQKIKFVLVKNFWSNSNQFSVILIRSSELASIIFKFSVWKLKNLKCLSHCHRFQVSKEGTKSGFNSGFYSQDQPKIKLSILQASIWYTHDTRVLPMPCMHSTKLYSLALLRVCTLYLCLACDYLSSQYNHHYELCLETQSHWIQVGIEPRNFWSRVARSAIWATMLW